MRPLDNELIAIKPEENGVARGKPIISVVGQHPSPHHNWRGASPPVPPPPLAARTHRAGLTALAVVLAVVFGSLVLTVGGLALYASVAGDPYGRTYVERREDGYYLGVRDCEPLTITSVEVSLYDENAFTPPPPIWTSSTRSGGLRTLKLFNENPGFKQRAVQPPYPATTYVILTNPASSYSYLTTDLATLRFGQVDYGGPKPVTLDAYERLSNSKFGCV